MCDVTEINGDEPRLEPYYSIAQAYGATVERSTECDRNHAGAAGHRIFLGEFDDPDIELVAFFHELGHTQMFPLLGKSQSMSKISMEGTAWELGLALAKRHGYDWDYYSKQMRYARDCLRSYVLDGHCILELTNVKSKL